jgi:hypothetical protein
MNRLIAFAALSAIVVVTPGPDSLLVLRNVCVIEPAGRPVAPASREAISATVPWLPWA